jgi:hypothetical protein
VKAAVEGDEQVGPKELLLIEIEQLPDTVVEEVIDFAKFLKRKALQDNLGTAVASESSLKKDWLLPKEESAWQDL